MSRGFPDRARDVTRQNWDMTVEKTGSPCTLVRVTRTPADELMTSFTESTVEVETHIIMHWPKDSRKLEDGGIYTNEQLPIEGFVRFADKVKIGDRIVIGTDTNPEDVPTNVNHQYEVKDVVVEDDDPLRVKVLLSATSELRVTS